MQYTPMMMQYLEIKENYKDCILFFRLGDFYEMFFDDAITASRELEITLTGKNCGQEERAPMCGVPFHSADSYVARLVDRGYKVAICEQVEDPATAKGIVKREVIQIITPGTVVSQSMLNEKENNYLASIFITEEEWALAYCDISTGELNITAQHTSHTESLINQLVKINAKEILVNEDCELYISLEDVKKQTAAYLQVLDKYYHEKNTARDAILRQFNIKSMNGIGLTEGSTQAAALGALLTYLFETRKQSMSHINRIKILETGSSMSLDKATLRNLEITETLYEKKVSGSLLGVLDKTHTAMGSRKMKQWLKEPLIQAEAINRRLDAVECLYDEVIIRNNIKESLKRVYDLERLSGRVACGNANGKDLLALRNSLFVLPEIKDDLSSFDDSLLNGLDQRIHGRLQEICQLIEKSISEDAPFTIKEGKLIKPGYSEELDNLRESIRDGQQWIANLEATEKERTGIKTLKVRFNKVFGYYIEVTKANLDMVPENYIRKQTLVNCERFITPELKEMESLVLNAETKINQMEYEIFNEIKDIISDYIPEIQDASEALAVLDVLQAFAQVSSDLGYVRPQVDDRHSITIVKGRHPVIERTIENGVFVSNDLYVDTESSSMLLITGPNMAGKSTYMRQTALIVLMAQTGCFVPCEKASIGVVDRIYTRIGASDNLAMGQSTFFVEMSELAYILNTATDRSLIILDEIGRGTSTYDGLSIAWAALEYLCNKTRRIRTLFATHYHELTLLENYIAGVRNLNVDVAEENGEVVFLHKIVEGSANRSYGIHVAKLAGVPKEILENAKNKLAKLESGQDVGVQAGIATETTANKGSEEKQSPKGEKETPKEADGEVQLSLFSFAPNPVIERLKEINLMELAPWEALKILGELQEAAKDGKTA